MQDKNGEKVIFWRLGNEPHHAFYFSHKSVAVRKVTAQCLVQVVERMGAGRILSGVKDITDRIMPTVANLSSDANPHVRFVLKSVLNFSHVMMNSRH